MSYAIMVMLYYLCVLALLAPWFILLLGALRRLLRQGGRLRRLQAEGTAMLVTGSIAKWLVFDVNFGFDRLRNTEWSWWFSRGEIGFFLIGFLLLGMGYFLERRPRPGLEPWPRTGKKLSIAAILTGAALGLLAYTFRAYPWFELPWTAPRILFSLGIYPFAVFYFTLGKRDRAPYEDD